MSKAKTIDINELDGFGYCPFTGVIFRTKDSRGCKEGQIVGTKDKHGYNTFRYRNKNYKAHRVAFILMGKQLKPEDSIDHINGDPFDNRWKNLRIVDHRKNMCNRKAHRSGKLVGTSKLKSGKFGAWIKSNRKSFYLGTFDSALDAHNAYLSARRKLEVCHRTAYQ